MKNKLHVIYVPGIGDNNPQLQAKAISTWKLYGVEPELFQMNWADKRPWQVKFDQLLGRIDELSGQGHNVALVGASAGGGAVVNAYAARKDKVVGVVTISGKIHRPDKIGSRYRKNNSSFVESAYAVPDSLEKLSPQDREHILCRFGLFDEIVPVNESRIDGAKNLYAPTLFHGPSIAFQLLFGAVSLMGFLKKQMSAISTGTKVS